MSNEKNTYPLLSVMSWLGPILGFALLIASVISGGWSAATFSGSIASVPSGLLGIMLGAGLGLLTGAAIAFPYFLLGELSRAIIDLVTSNIQNAEDTRKLLDHFGKQSE